MAYFDAEYYAARDTLRQRLARVFETPLDRATREKARRIATLRALSDDELAARGLTRDAILMHVFTGGGGDR